MHRKKEKLRQLPRYTWEHVGETSGLFFFILVRHFPWWEPCDFCVTDIVILSSHPHWTSFVGLQIEITVLFIWSWGFGLKNTLRKLRQFSQGGGGHLSACYSLLWGGLSLSCCLFISTVSEYVMKLLWRKTPLTWKLLLFELEGMQMNMLKEMNLENSQIRLLLYCCTSTADE